MARLALMLFGPLEATLDGALITTFESNKVRALLAYLAAEADRPQRREALASLLWLVELWVRNADDPSRSWGWSWGLGPLACAVLFVAVVVLSPPSTRSFIYFQF